MPSNWDAGSLLGESRIVDCCVRPARLRISYGKDVIVFVEPHGLHCGETVLAIVKGTGLARLRAESF